MPEARSIVAALVLCVLAPSACAAQGNFTSVHRRYVLAAEQARVDSAVLWTGRELPRWSEPCHILVKRGALSGHTRFVFDSGEVFGWRMTCVGRSPEEVVDAVIPHEVDHAVRASITRQPQPRWLDEGCAVFHDPAGEHAQWRQVARDRHGAMPIDADWLDRMDYPEDGRDAFDMYACGFTMAEYLMERGGPQRLIAFQSDKRPVSDKLHDHYGETCEQFVAHWGVWIDARPIACVEVGCPFHTAYPQPVALAPSAIKEGDVIVFSAGWCGPCRLFWSHYTADKDGLRTWMDGTFREVWHADVDRHKRLAERYDVTRIPCFVVVGAGRVVEYSRPDVLIDALEKHAPEDDPSLALGEPADGGPEPYARGDADAGASAPAGAPGDVGDTEAGDTPGPGPATPRGADDGRIESFLDSASQVLTRLEQRAAEAPAETDGGTEANGGAATPSDSGGDEGGGGLSGMFGTALTLAQIAALFGVGVGGGGVGVAGAVAIAKLAGRLLRTGRAVRGRRRSRRAGTKGAPAQPDANGGDAPSGFEVERLPSQPVDYSRAWVDTVAREGGNPAAKAGDLTIYTETLDAVKSGAIALPGLSLPDQQKLANAVRRWVEREFRQRHVSAPQRDNINHKAFLAYLYEKAVERIAAGEFGRNFRYVEAANAIEEWVDSRFAHVHLASS